MLVLSRYRDESIFIGDDIKVTVVDIRGDRVRLGIQAPPNVTVHRQEVYEAIAGNKDRGTAPSKPVRHASIKDHVAALGTITVDIDTANGAFGELTADIVK